MPQQEFGLVRSADAGLTDNSLQVMTLDTTGALVVLDFFAKAVLDGHGYQVRAGTVTTPLVGDVVITDTAAEYCIDATTGFVAIPIAQNISIRLGTGTLHEYAVKSVATVSSAGTAFTLLPLKSNGEAASLTGRVSAAGGVTVTAELATTTVRHWSFSQPIAMGAYVADCRWEPLRPPVLVGPRCLYTQIAATTTGPSYYANMDVLQFTTAQIGA